MTKGGEEHMLRAILAIIAMGMSLVAEAAAVAHPNHGTQSERADAMGTSASAFLATLSTDQQSKAVRPFEDDAGRTNWSNLPSVLYEYGGVALAELTPNQRIAFHNLLAASLSSQGYGKATAIMWIEDILREEEYEQLKAANLTPERNSEVERLIQSRQSDNYWVTVFGEPSTRRWGWMLSGHHLAANFTVVDGRIAFTPLFLGVAPQTISNGRYAGWRVLGHEIDSGFALMRSLEEKQQAEARIAEVVTNDLFTGKGRKDSLKAAVGIPASKLNRSQQDRLFILLDEFTGSAAPEAAEAQMEVIRRDGLDKLYFAWWGDVEDPSKRFMYRIHGPSILIEYVREARRGEPSNHVHAIVRDPRNDYGEDWLSKHYQEQPHP